MFAYSYSKSYHERAMVEKRHTPCKQSKASALSELFNITRIFKPSEI